MDITEIQFEQNSEQNYIQKYLINDFKSGQQIDFTFQLLDEENKIISFKLQSIFNKEYHLQVIEEIVNYNVKITIGNDDIKIFG